MAARRSKRDHRRARGLSRTGGPTPLTCPSSCPYEHVTLLGVAAGWLLDGGCMVAGWRLHDGYVTTGCHCARCANWVGAAGAAGAANVMMAGKRQRGNACTTKISRSPKHLGHGGALVRHVCTGEPPLPHQAHITRTPGDATPLGTAEFHLARGRMRIVDFRLRLPFERAISNVCSSTARGAGPHTRESWRALMERAAVRHEA